MTNRDKILACAGHLKINSIAKLVGVSYGHVYVTLDREDLIVEYKKPFRNIHPYKNKNT